ncbi:MAG: membrane protein insertion efficiency factor YidD [Actinobacteria bacterium]|nr:membrane protein insertion efficiency factor YidD [Actinomycetota bacterium]
MVFIGGWRSRRRGYGGYGGYPGPGGYGPGGYGPGGYGPPRRSGCARDLCLVESGCCLAELLGCGPQLALVGPSLVRRSVRAARLTGQDPAVGSWLLRFVLAAITLYQREISPRRRPCCRFSPTCSHYASQALRMHGLRRGGWLAVRRLLRCRPGTAGGPDPVPQP